VKRLLVVNKAYWPHLGGVETVVRQLAEGAAEAGWVVDVLCLAETDAEEEINDVRVHRIKAAARLGSAPLAWNFLDKYRELAARADVIHYHAPNPMGELALLLRGRGSAQKVVCTYHSDPLRPRWATPASKKLLRAFLKRCDAIVATSPNYIQSSPVLKPIENRCTVIPLGVDVERFANVASETIATCEWMLEGLSRPRVLFVGRLVYYKGVDVLLKAVAQVPEVSAVMVGEGPLKRELMKQGEKLGIQSRVRFLDPLPEDLLPLPSTTVPICSCCLP
jgi:Glycosyltransferase